MRRYNITPDTETGAYAYARFEQWEDIKKEIRIKIDEADNGEWVRYEDVQQYVELTDAQKANAEGNP